MLIAIYKSAAKVQQILHICKRSGYFFEKKSDLSPICKYWVAIGSLLTDSYSVLTNARTIVRILKKITRLCICTAGCERNFGGNPCTGGPKYCFFFTYATFSAEKIWNINNSPSLINKKSHKLLRKAILPHPIRTTRKNDESSNG